MRLRDVWIDHVEAHTADDVAKLATLAVTDDARWMLTALLHGMPAEAVLIMQLLAARPLHEPIAALAVAARIEADPEVRAAVDAPVRDLLGWRADDGDDLWAAVARKVSGDEVVAWTAEHFDDLDLRRAARRASAALVAGWEQPLTRAVEDGSAREAIAALHLAADTDVGRRLADRAGARGEPEVTRWLAARADGAGAAAPDGVRSE
jgi:hypothetical protein